VVLLPVVGELLLKHLEEVSRVVCTVAVRRSTPQGNVLDVGMRRIVKRSPVSPWRGEYNGIGHPVLVSVSPQKSANPAAQAVASG